MTDRSGPDAEVRDRGGVPWSDGQLTLRVRGPGPAPGRIVRLARPFALIGRHPGADIRIPDRAAAPRHALLVLDRRGLFCVDLLTRRGTRLAGRDVASTWLGVGEVLEVAGWRLEILRLMADGGPIDPTPGDDDPFAPAGPGLDRVSLRPVDGPGPPWILGSPLAFVGRSPACGLRLLGSSAAPIHCAIWREPGSVRVIDLLGRVTQVNGRPVQGSAPLDDGDTLRVGRADFVVRLEPATRPAFPALPGIAGLPESVELIHVKPSLPEAQDGPSLADVMAFLRQFQGDAATLIEGQFGQIEALRRELIALRQDLHPMSTPAEMHLPFAMDVASTQPASSTEGTAAWLLDRINDLEPESRSRWHTLVGKFASLIGTRPPQSSTIIVPISKS